MICLKCKENGLKSIIRPGASSSTLIYNCPYYDEDGKYHYHDMNTTTTNYTCSNGHQWVIVSSRQSCWCGWPDNEKLYADTD